MHFQFIHCLLIFVVYPLTFPQLAASLYVSNRMLTIISLQSSAIIAEILEIHDQLISDD